MEVRQAANEDGSKQIVVIGLSKIDIAQLKNPGSPAVLICTSQNTIMAVSRIDHHRTTGNILKWVVDKLNAEVDKRKQEKDQSNEDRTTDKA